MGEKRLAEASVGSRQLVAVGGPLEPALGSCSLAALYADLEQGTVWLPNS